MANCYEKFTHLGTLYYKLRGKFFVKKSNVSTLLFAVGVARVAGSTLVYCYRCTTGRQFIDVCCNVGCIQGCLYTGSPSRQTINGCVCNGLMSTEPDRLIDTKLSFQMNYASICGTMMVKFVLDAMPVNTAFQSALWNDIVA
ncbi:uncharacterized protein TNCV_2575501 [Trichonephila clavipes]|uniref:Uncharacterized protein n=1 Tax=Trichonephila clavipes TaxID=2585209 RepID=A0A8X6UV17_TRICX|nr:uncharacterized protein TNCV_2575501 [Trichonephila clavipes]